MKRPVLFWATLVAVLIISALTLKLIHDFWYSKRNSKTAQYLKVVAILYPITLSIRMVFSMFSYVRYYGETFSVVGSCVSYVNGFLFYLVLLLWLYATFDGTIHQIRIQMISLFIAISAMNMILGCLMTIAYGRPYWSEEINTASEVTYGSVGFFVMIWIMFQFNSRLCKLLFYDDEFVSFITRQISIMFTIFLFNLAEFVSTMFSIYVPNSYDHNRWRFVRIFILVLRVAFIWLLFRYHLSYESLSRDRTSYHSIGDEDITLSGLNKL